MHFFSFRNKSSVLPRKRSSNQELKTPSSILSLEGIVEELFANYEINHKGFFINLGIQRELSYEDQLVRMACKAAIRPKDPSTKIVEPKTVKLKERKELKEEVLMLAKLYEEVANDRSLLQIDGKASPQEVKKAGDAVMKEVDAEHPGKNTVIDLANWAIEKVKDKLFKQMVQDCINNGGEFKKKDGMSYSDNEKFIAAAYNAIYIRSRIQSSGPSEKEFIKNIKIDDVLSLARLYIRLANDQSNNFSTDKNGKPLIREVIGLATQKMEAFAKGNGAILLALDSNDVKVGSVFTIGYAANAVMDQLDKASLKRRSTLFGKR